jgi:hypothetical protein
MVRVKKIDLIKKHPKIFIPQGEDEYLLDGNNINVKNPTGTKKELSNIIRDITGIKPNINFNKKQLSDLITGLFKERIKKTRQQVQNFVDDRQIISGEEVVEFLETDDLRFIDEIVNQDYNVVIKINNRSFTINNEKIKTIQGLLRDIIFREDMLSGSDRIIVGALNDIRNIDFIFRKKSNSYVRDESAEFPYYNTTKINLAPLQIYTKEQFKNDPNTETPCFIHCLKYFNIDEEKISKIRSYMKKKALPQKDLDEISKLLEVNIRLYKPKNQLKNNREITYYPKNKVKFDETIFICSYEGHYFPFIKNYYEISTFAINNYNNVKDLDDYTCIEGFYNNKYVRRYNKDFNKDTFELVDLMFKNNLFVKMGFDKYNYYSAITPSIIDRETFDNLEFGINLGKEYDFQQTLLPPKNIYSFDFETITNNHKHIPYQVCFSEHKDNSEIFYYEGKNCGLRMLQKLAELHNGEQIILYAHNAKYDLSFLFDYLYNDTFTGDTNTIYQYCGEFKYFENEIKIKIRDSYKLINKKLADFPEMFNLPFEKEVINYQFYTMENIEKRFHTIDSYCYGLTTKKKNQLIENVNKLGLLNENNEFDIVKYSKYYCEKDVEVLTKSLIQFRKWIKEITGLDIYNYLTISSIAWNFVGVEGCLDEVYSLKGTPAQFIKHCVIGGRTMTANNQVIDKSDKNYKISDFDAVGLYQSSMALSDGWLKGKPKVLKKEELNKTFLDKQDGYFVKININNIGIKRDFPLISSKENNIRVFTNEVEKLKNVFVDKYSLEDLIEFQNIDYEIIEGYYYNEGRNETIKEIQNILFTERNKMKKLENPIQEVYKLIGNSIYGKSIEKEHLNNLKIKNKNDVWNYFDKNYKRVNEIVELTEEKYLVIEDKSLNDYHSFAHIGCEVLSYSKRIMNQVMCLAEDNNIQIYYQDTDSMHIDTENIEQLSNLFEEKYQKKLIGKNLGQFHTDFKSDILSKGEEIYAIQSIFLGKKCYIDKLTTDKDYKNNIFDYHIRYKGIPNSCILRECKDNNISPLEMYKQISNDESFEIDLSKILDDEGNKVDKILFYFENFKVFTQDLQINPFKRTMKLKENK